MLRPHVPVRRYVAQQRNIQAFGRGAKILDMAAMQWIEGAVHHRHLPPVVLQLIERENHAVSSNSRGPAPAHVQIEAAASVVRSQDFTNSPLSFSSCSARSKKSTATSGVV